MWIYPPHTSHSAVTISLLAKMEMLIVSNLELWGDTLPSFSIIYNLDVNVHDNAKPPSYISASISPLPLLSLISFSQPQSRPHAILLVSTLLFLFCCKFMSCNGMASSSSASFFSPNYMLHMQTARDEQKPLLQNTAAPCGDLQDLRVVAPVLGKRSVCFSGMENGEEVNAEDDFSDDGMQAGEKKRRLNMEQVRTLEKNFEQGNKLEPERKLQLARALGLQPRQVAIWFQNRRARWKTKQLEKDYDVLKRQFEGMKSENEALQAQNKKLQAEILALRGREGSELINLNKETEGSCSNRSENSSEINLEISKTSLIESNLNLHQSLPFYPSMRAGDIDQLLQNSSRADQPPQCPKILETGAVNEGSFSNLLCSIDDHSASFWPWPDHHGFH